MSFESDVRVNLLSRTECKDHDLMKSRKRAKHTPLSSPLSNTLAIAQRGLLELSVSPLPIREWNVPSRERQAGRERGTRGVCFFRWIADLVKVLPRHVIRDGSQQSHAPSPARQMEQRETGGRDKKVLDRSPMLGTLVLLLFVAARTAFGQTVTGDSKPGSLLFVAKKAFDVTGPTIEILEPIEVSQRGMKAVTEGGMVVSSGELKVRGVAHDSSAVAVVKVQGREADLKPTARGYEFGADVLLEFGSNTITIVATDIHGNSGTVSINVRREVAVAKLEKKSSQVEVFKGHQVWAAVIGISEYQSPGIAQLRYADRDAEAFYEYLITPLSSGGRGVSQANVRKLINKEATRVNIEESIKDFMKNAIEEDVVIIYFAGHGIPDPVRPDIPYLLAYDSDLTRPGATAVRMQEIQDAIRYYIKAKKVVVFADACHSAGVGGNIAMRGQASSEVVNKFLEDIAKAGSSVLTLSASEANEFSQESPQWGGGHGVFTYHLLEGLKGKANVDADPIVRLGELVDYVSQNVRRDTKSQQHPTASQSQWDRNLPMSIGSETEKR
jgi:hypothetical protein